MTATFSAADAGLGLCTKFVLASLVAAPIRKEPTSSAGVKITPDGGGGAAG